MWLWLWGDWYGSCICFSTTVSARSLFFHSKYTELTDLTAAHKSELDKPAIIGKVTMLYGNNSVYERAFRTHEEHSRRLGYPLLTLRKPVLDGVWNKYFVLLSVLVQELEKPADKRLQWLL